MRLGTVAAAACALAALASCGPKLPAGVDEAALSDAVSEAVGDPSTCLLIGRRGEGQAIWRYNTHMVCGRSLAACDAPGRRTPGDLLEAVALDGRRRGATCDNPQEPARTIAWAAGPAGGDLVYAAVMDSERAFPSLIMSERIERALARGGLDAKGP